MNNSNQSQSEQTKIINKLKFNKMKNSIIKNSNQSNVKSIKTETMNKKIKLPFGIKQPTTVDEFRENLKKYYVTEGNKLYIMDRPSIPLEQISSLDDIYQITKTGFYGLGGSPSITPKVLLKKNFSQWMKETNQSVTFFDYFFNEENFEIIEEQDEFLKIGKPTWWSLDNQIMREFYIITLGDYCGYKMNIS